MIHVTIFALIAAGAALLALLAFVAVVALGVRATERRLALRQPGYGRIDTFTRRLLGVYADRSRCKDETAEYEHTRG